MFYHLILNKKIIFKKGFWMRVFFKKIVHCGQIFLHVCVFIMCVPCQKSQKVKTAPLKQEFGYELPSRLWELIWDPLEQQPMHLSHWAMSLAQEKKNPEYCSQEQIKIKRCLLLIQLCLNGIQYHYIPIPRELER